MSKQTFRKNLTLAGPPRLAKKLIVSEAGLSRFAKSLAARVLKNSSAKSATVIALSGELGAGKTTFTKAFLKFLGVREAVTSPTFILFRPYPLPQSFKLKAISYKLPFQMAYHIDCYRLEDPKELLRLGLKEMLANPRHIVVIEWAERIKKYLPKSAMWLTLKHGPKKNQRCIAILGL